MKSTQLRDMDEATLREHITTARRDLFGLRMQHATGELDDNGLLEHIRTQRRELFGLRFSHATGELENTAGVSTAKRDLARALTVANERGLDPEEIR